MKRKLTGAKKHLRPHKNSLNTEAQFHTLATFTTTLSMHFRSESLSPFLSLLIVVVLLSGCNRKNESTNSEATTEIMTTYITTFQFGRPDRIALEYYNKMSDQRDSIPAQAKYEITDSNQIDEFMALATKLQDKGDRMIKMGDVPLLNVTLVYPGEKLYFTFYQNRIKTPDTSFYSNSPQEEKRLHEFLFSLLNK